MGRQSIPDGLELNGLHIVKDGIVSICLLPLAGGDMALFDAGNDKSGKAIRGELSRLGLGPRKCQDDISDARPPGPFPAGLFHSLLHAGLSRRTACPTG
jgi:hypothetical protein